jgi:hypothetical protein
MKSYDDYEKGSAKNAAKAGSPLEKARRSSNSSKSRMTLRSGRCYPAAPGVGGWHASAIRRGQLRSMALSVKGLRDPGKNAGIGCAARNSVARSEFYPV